MAASAWGFYNEAKHYLGTGDINFSSGIFRVSLYTSASDAATLTQSIITEISGEVTEANGYLSSGKTFSATTWTTGSGAAEQRFDATAVFWSASGGTIPNIKFAVVWVSAATSAARKLLCFSQLSTSQFTLASGDRLTITPTDPNGIFELN